ncbi:unnamed protein product [Angiostrongylus costaricensis]|uniref:SCAPER_N domain-containing protein n=1 Tax=Angiostrongylus costaricensis TaxID=334426 RepID=A0A0R3Q137_ANGCS|nr:unnamed protein product [Angiostrongylus costaricensis]
MKYEDEYLAFNISSSTTVSQNNVYSKFRTEARSTKHQQGSDSRSPHAGQNPAYSIVSPLRNTSLDAKKSGINKTSEDSDQIRNRSYTNTKKLTQELVALIWKKVVLKLENSLFMEVNSDLDALCPSGDAEPSATLTGRPMERIRVEGCLDTVSDLARTVRNREHHLPRCTDREATSGTVECALINSSTHRELAAKQQADCGILTNCEVCLYTEIKNKTNSD